jgi:hypothetical protein
MNERPRIEIREDERGRHVIASAAIERGEVLVRYSSQLVEVAAMYTIQLDERRHLAPSGGPGDFTNHGCDPNARVDFEDLSLRAVKPIAPGEEVRFNYLTTEWEMAAPFDCQCGAPECFGRIAGFKHLPRLSQERLRPLLSPFLRRKLDGSR